MHLDSTPNSINNLQVNIEQIENLIPFILDIWRRMVNIYLKNIYLKFSLTESHGHREG